MLEYDRRRGVSRAQDWTGLETVLRMPQLGPRRRPNTAGVDRSARTNYFQDEQSNRLSVIEQTSSRTARPRLRRGI